MHLLRANRLAIGAALTKSKFSVLVRANQQSGHGNGVGVGPCDGKDIAICQRSHLQTKPIQFGLASREEAIARDAQRSRLRRLKSKQETAAIVTIRSCALPVYDHDTTPIMVASLVITRTQVRFYLAARTVVNVFAPRTVLGSARVSRAGDCVESLAIANFSYVFDQASYEAARKFVSA